MTNLTDQQALKQRADQLQKSIDDANSELAKMKELLNKPPERAPLSTVFKPKVAERYFYIGPESVDSFTYNSDNVDTRIIELKPVFRSQREAELYANHLKALNKYRTLAGDQSWVDWTDSSQFKHCLTYIGGVVEIGLHLELRHIGTNYYLKDRKQAQEVMNQFTREEIDSLFYITRS